MRQQCRQLLKGARMTGVDDHRLEPPKCRPALKGAAWIGDEEILPMPGGGRREGEDIEYGREARLPDPDGFKVIARIDNLLGDEYQAGGSRLVRCAHIVLKFGECQGEQGLAGLDWCRLGMDQG